jgi:hypothetical protein
VTGAAELGGLVVVGVLAVVLVGYLVWLDYCDQHARQTLHRTRQQHQALEPSAPSSRGEER